LPDLWTSGAKQSAQEIVETIMNLPVGSRLLVLAPMVRERKGTYQALFDEISKSGFTRVRVDGLVFNLDEQIEIDRYQNIRLKPSSIAL